MSTPRARIMIVDDNPSHRSMLGREFRREGFDSKEVSDGLEAIGYIKSTEPDPPDVFVIDLKLAGASGVELIKLVRLIRVVSRRTMRPARIVAHTCAYPGNPIIEEAVQAGADAVVLKTGDFDHLLAVVRGEHPGDVAIVRSTNP